MVLAMCHGAANDKSSVSILEGMLNIRFACALKFAAQELGIICMLSVVQPVRDRTRYNSEEQGDEDESRGYHALLQDPG